jgi:hypothetical protein
VVIICWYGEYLKIQWKCTNFAHTFSLFKLWWIMHNYIPSLFINMKWIWNCMHWHSRLENAFQKHFLFIETKFDYNLNILSKLFITKKFMYLNKRSSQGWWTTIIKYCHLKHYVLINYLKFCFVEMKLEL